MFFEEINKVDIFLAQLIRKKKTPITSFRNERSDITLDFICIKEDNKGSIINNFILINLIT